MFEEVASVSPPMQGAGTTNTVLAVSAFKSIEPSPNAKLIKEWKVTIPAPAWVMLGISFDCIFLLSFDAFLFQGSFFFYEFLF